jgi:UDP-glucose 4-epimerase
MITWVVGRGGLLGSAVSRAVRDEFVGGPVPWTDPGDAAATLRSELTRFATAAGARDWAIVWAAGSGVVASEAQQLQDELDVLASFVDALAEHPPAGRGVFALASSAGGVYAGSRHPPFDESTVPRPLSPYGEAKLAAEQLTEARLSGRVPMVIGRLSNLYGPGQDLTKRQGLVSELCLGAIRRRSVNVYVPMQTLRDYLYADDAAAMIADLALHAVTEQPRDLVLRNLASGLPMSVGGVVRVVQQVTRQTVRIGMGQHPSAALQVLDLRMTTRAGALPRLHAPTTFPAGVRRVYEHTFREFRGAHH